VLKKHFLNTNTRSERSPKSIIIIILLLHAVLLLVFVMHKAAK